MRRAAVVTLGLLVGCSAASREPVPALATDACLDFGGDRADVGFDAVFVIDVKSTCAEVLGGGITWKQVAGAPLREQHVSNNGFRLSARTARAAALLPEPWPWGIVPVSPRTRGEVGLEAAWRDSAGHRMRRELRVAAVARSHGLPNTAVGTRALLGGEGWRLIESPPGASATVDVSDRHESLRPDVAGTFHLVDGRGHQLDLRAGRFDDTPLDCGRSGCHAEIATAARASPMASVLARGLRAGSVAHARGDYPRCALGCHAVGEPGIADGGFVHVATEMGIAPDAQTTWEQLPAALRRQGGVGCLACHGPGAVPEAAARWSVLRSDVCAVCHDAPPRYGHVAAWRTSRMARADAAPRTRSQQPCVRCHTTWGSLASAQPGASARRPPDADDVGPIGIACVACHAVHEPGTAQPARALLRETPVPTVLGDILPTARARSGTCLACHAPQVDGAQPFASAAALWLGRGGIDPQSGAPLRGAAPHGLVDGGCVACHRAGPPEIERGAGHAFRADRSACRACHTRELPLEDLRGRAQALWRRLVALTGLLARDPAGAEPLHAFVTGVDRSRPLGRAAWNVLLVLEDRAAAVHNQPYARALLDAAEKAVDLAPAMREPRK